MAFSDAEGARILTGSTIVDSVLRVVCDRGDGRVHRDIVVDLPVQVAQSVQQAVREQLYSAQSSPTHTHPRIDSLLTKLMLYVINTGVATSILSTACLVSVREPFSSDCPPF